MCVESSKIYPLWRRKIQRKSGAQTGAIAKTIAPKYARKRRAAMRPTARENVKPRGAITPTMPRKCAIECADIEQLIPKNRVNLSGAGGKQTQKQGGQSRSAGAPVAGLARPAPIPRLFKRASRRFTRNRASGAAQTTTSAWIISGRFLRAAAMRPTIYRRYVARVILGRAAACCLSLKNVSLIGGSLNAAHR